jgi:hypothetical protein
MLTWSVERDCISSLYELDDLVFRSLLELLLSI